jgi:hypothetical protein
MNKGYTSLFIFKRVDNTSPNSRDVDVVEISNADYILDRGL